MSALPLYWHTLVHLRREQLIGRVLHRLKNALPAALDVSAAPPLRSPRGDWALPARRRQSQFGLASFRFLHEPRDVATRADWNDAAVPLLWRYNLHYFDDLNAEGAEARDRWHRAVVERWILENPPVRGVGWDPYPTSLRIINWIKWAIAGHPLSVVMQHSLVLQVRHLARRLEYHLLGNHLFVNAKALIFAGLFFDGAEAERWLSTGLKILRRELPEQILADGGQFERSPMYHALALEDLLDLQNIGRRYTSAPSSASAFMVQAVGTRIHAMRQWLAMMCHPDGEISFFNDAAVGIAPSPAELDAYAQRLGHAAMLAPNDGVVHLEASGYVRVQRGEIVALLDCAPVGPDYLPGHAHADTLSFELSVAGQRLIVNGGTSEYGAGPQRQRERSTAAHSTVEVEGENSSEVWSGFRVARRARPFDLRIDDSRGAWTIAASHDGYRRLPGRVLHRRQWRVEDKAVSVTDRLLGAHRSAKARFHLHPDVHSSSAADEGMLFSGSAPAIAYALKMGCAAWTDSVYCPEFGVRIPMKCLTVELVDGTSEIRLGFDEDSVSVG